MADSQYWTITLCNWKKQPAELFFYKDVVIRNFVIFTEKHQCEILKNIYFEEDLRTADCQLTLWSDCWEVIVSGSHIKLSWLSNITKYQYSVILQNTSRFQIKALNKSLAHIPSIYLTMVTTIWHLHFLVNLSFIRSSLTVTTQKEKVCSPWTPC